jgi:hypothetical protein
MLAEMRPTTIVTEISFKIQKQATGIGLANVSGAGGWWGGEACVGGVG